MKVNRVIHILSCLVLLNSCITIGRSGFYVPVNKKFYNKNSNSPIYNLISFPADFIEENIFSEEKGQNINLLLPQMIDQNSHATDIIFLPFFFLISCNCISIDRNFSIEIRGTYTKDFINNSQIYIKRNNKIYGGEKTLIPFYRGYSKETDIFFPHFSFPFKIKDFKEGVIVIKYKDYKKEIPIKYEKRFYSYTSHQ